MNIPKNRKSIVAVVSLTGITAIFLSLIFLDSKEISQNQAHSGKKLHSNQNCLISDKLVLDLLQIPVSNLNTTKENNKQKNWFDLLGEAAGCNYGQILRFKFLVNVLFDKNFKHTKLRSDKDLIMMYQNCDGEKKRICRKICLRLELHN